MAAHPNSAFPSSSQSSIPKPSPKLRRLSSAAYDEGESKLKGNGKSVPPLDGLKQPLRDGDRERPDDDAYKGSYFINANSSTAPGLIDRDRNPILDRSEIYSGIFARFSAKLYAFNTNGNKGIACGLQNVQKLSDGTILEADRKR